MLVNYYLYSVACNEKLSYVGRISEPCCISEPTVSQSEFLRLKLFSNSSGSAIHGCGLCHSSGAILYYNIIKITKIFK